MDNFGHQFKRTGGLLFSPVEPYPLYFLLFQTQNLCYTKDNHVLIRSSISWQKTIIMMPQVLPSWKA